MEVLLVKQLPMYKEKQWDKVSQKIITPISSTLVQDSQLIEKENMFSISLRISLIRNP